MSDKFIYGVERLADFRAIEFNPTKDAPGN